MSLFFSQYEGSADCGDTKMSAGKNLSRVGEDYLKQIYLLLKERREARVVDLADHFGVTASTATKAVKALAAGGFVSSRPYRSIFLTEAGKAIARDVLERNRLIRDSLMMLGIDEAQAAADADRLEHGISPEALTALRNKFLQDMSVVKKER